MTESNHGPRLEALRALEDTFLQHCSRRAQTRASGEKLRLARVAWWRIRGGLRRPLVRRLLAVGTACLALAGIAVGGLWLRLMAGPIEINLASPFLAAAIEENIGRRHHVEIGGTQIERDEGGRRSAPVEIVT
jgi:hypothetical protein